MLGPDQRAPLGEEAVGRAAMLLVLLNAVTGVRNGRWSTSDIVDFMDRHPNRAYFSRLFRDGGLLTGMEVGVADGRFSEHFLLDAGDRLKRWYMVEPAPNAELVARFPPASPKAADTSPGPLARLWSWLNRRSWQSRGIGARTEIVHFRSMSLDPKIFAAMHPHSVDFIYIDSSHMYEVTKKELVAYWRLLRQGGVLAGHDYCDHGESPAMPARRCRGCQPVPRCLPYTEYGLAHGKPRGVPSKSQTEVVRAVQEWVVQQGHTLHFTSETFTRSSLRADGMNYDLLLTSTRNPSWFVVKGHGEKNRKLSRRSSHILDRAPSFIDGRVAELHLMQKRGAASVSSYEAKQASKLNDRLEKNMPAIFVGDAAVEASLYTHFSTHEPWGHAGGSPFRGKAVLCVGARLGGEVRAFTRLGALAIGIDFNPGPRNPWSQWGDATRLSFANSTYDYVYSNVIDHITPLSRFAAECHRVLKGGGTLILHVLHNPPDGYSVQTFHTRELRRQVKRTFLASAPFLQTKSYVYDGTQVLLSAGLTEMVLKTHS